MAQRSHWGSRFGFVLAAAGSAVGLGNIWKFPYVTGENGGGWFVLIYLICIALVGLPIMMAEIFIGRTAQNSPVGAYRTLSRPRSPWILSGFMGVACAFIILSFYSVVAGWSMHYAWMSITNSFGGLNPTEINDKFGEVASSGGVQVFWHVVFMGLTVAIVFGGIQGGLERWSRILMPALFAMLLFLLVRAAMTDKFGEAMRFVFEPRAGDLKPSGVLEAMGQAFFSLSLGMGALITYGSYLRREDNLVTTSVMVCVMDTAVALMAAMILFPIVFSYNMEPDAGPGLVFQKLPIAFSEMPGGAIWATLFFVLLIFAALTSAISLLEVAASYFIDERGWSRTQSTLACGGAILLLGLPSALGRNVDAFGPGFAKLTGRLGLNHGDGYDWFDSLDKLTSNLMLPIGGLLIASFVAWRVGAQAREEGFKSNTVFDGMYWGWVQLLRWVVPIAVILVFLQAIGVLDIDSRFGGGTTEPAVVPPAS